MFNIWRASTIVFVLQAALGLTLFVETKSKFGSAVVVTFVTFLVLSGLKTRSLRDDLYAVLPAALCGAFTVVFATYPWGPSDVCIVAGIAAIAGASLAMAQGTDQKRADPWALVFIASLPLGIGTVFGGMILLWRRLYDSAFTPVA